VDKGARFTDWARRPLSEKQLSYAMGDVTHLRDMYPDMVSELEERGRLSWVQEEMAPLLDPDRAWERLKVRNPKRDYLAALKAVAAWRERTAKEKNVPRRRVLKDDGLYDIAQQRPKDLEALARLRGVPKGFERSRYAKVLIADLNTAMDDVENYAPVIPKTKHMPAGIGPATDMLKTLLKLRSEYDDIAPRLIASQKEVEQIAAFGDKADVPALRGWRREVFGEDALKMLEGKIVLKLDGRKVIAQPVDP
jgi:ribonuclease D